MADGQRDSIRAAATLAQSARVRALAIWALTAVVGPCAGWIAGKLDTKIQVERLSQKIDGLSGDLAVLTSQQRDLAKAIETLTAAPSPGVRPGRLYELETQVRYAHRNAVRATAVGLSSARSQHGKLDAAEPLLEAFDRRTERDGKSPSDAADVVISQIAVR